MSRIMQLYSFAKKALTLLILWLLTYGSLILRLIHFDFFERVAVFADAQVRPWSVKLSDQVPQVWVINNSLFVEFTNQNWCQINRHSPDAEKKAASECTFLQPHEEVFLCRCIFSAIYKLSCDVNAMRESWLVSEQEVVKSINVKMTLRSAAIAIDSLCMKPVVQRLINTQERREEAKRCSNTNYSLGFSQQPIIKKPKKDIWFVKQ